MMVKQIRVIVSLGMLTLPLTATAEDVETLIAGMMKYEKSLVERSEWIVEYTQKREMHNLPEGYSPEFPDKRWINARKRKQEFLEEETLTGSNPGNITIRIYGDDRLGVLYDDDGQYTILPQKPPEFYQAYFITDALFLDCYVNGRDNDDISKQLTGFASHSEFFRQFALPHSVSNNADKYKLRPDKEECDGSSCFVLEQKGRDIIWIDPDHNYICRRREMFRENGNPSTLVENTGLKNEDGFWYPTLQRRSVFNREKDGELSGTLRYVMVNAVSSLKFEVPDSLFRPPRPERTIVFDGIRDKTYTVTSDHDHPDDLMSDAIAQAEYLMANEPKPPGSSGPILLIVALNVCLIILVMLYIKLKST